MPEARARPRRAEGQVTRGTTAPNRLRRIDRWIVGTRSGLLRGGPPPLVVDLGFGASPVTTVELFGRLRAVRADVSVVGLEIDPERVAAARPHLRPGLDFAHGGFELPVARPPVLVRALNVLRQYDEAAAYAGWAALRARLAPGGLLVEGTCDETGRRAVWAAVAPDGPVSITFAAHLGSFTRPSALAERLPKTLIHRNVPGEPVHAFLREWDAAWDRAAGYAAFGKRQRWVRAAAGLRGRWPLLDGPSRWRLGELTVPWRTLAPVGRARG
ncbi:SAM-dependent methyltransferase [Allonocardiopsis opalescens]|uniref:Methyltransferase family protein n=1 Tax=Allonocardiopsis opalescens TaxID=1144618 RepID=A0A2T0QA65_9ACTN|nr:SAM-dependent methyltransferase [Allonocardiopsis opalescens]PRY00737.1 hypothetical protein CLV72_102369 [Allonocardiopsis opalescens]